MRQRVWRYIVATVVVLLHLVIFQVYPAWRLEAVATDWWFKIRGPIHPPEDILVIGIDQESYEKMGVSSEVKWPRKLHVQLLKRLAELGVKRAVFDLLFSSADSSFQDDMRLAEAFKLLPTVIAVVETPASGNRLRKLEVPLDLFSENVEQVGHVVVPVDAGVIRRFKSFQTNPVLSQFLTLAEAAAGRVGPTGRDIINFYGPAGTIKSLSFYRLLDEENPMSAEDLEGKIVFVGLYLDVGSPAAPVDQFQTPFYRSRTFGVEIQATAAANIMRGEWIRRLPSSIEVIGLSLILMLLTFSVITLRPTWGALLIVGSVATWGMVSYHSFVFGWFIPGVSAFLILLPLTFLCSTVYYYAVSFRSERFIRRAFSLYLMPEMVDEIVRTRSGLELGGRAVEAVIMFSDIAGFTSLAEEMKPDRVSQMLNCYFSAASDVVMNERGTVVDFIGDSMFAIWGAPIQIDGGADRAVRAARQIDSAIRRLTAEGSLPALQTRFGIHCGSVIAGNMGSSKRIKYTALGDAVNLASRVEQLGKQLGLGLLITGEAKKLLTGSYSSIPFGLVQVAGKEKAVELWAILEDVISVDLQNRWQIALGYLQSRNWSKARAAFGALISTDSLGKAAHYMVEAAVSFEENPPTGPVTLEFKSK